MRRIEVAAIWKHGRIRDRLLLAIYFLDNCLVFVSFIHSYMALQSYQARK